MTNESQPELGSGALREAQAELITELVDVGKSFWPSEAIRNSKINSIAQRLAALSLPSPIEPNRTELRDMLEAACVMAEMDEVPARATVLWWRAALRGEKPPTPQASSEIRERVEAELAAIRKDYGRTNWFTLMEHFCKRVTDALAPSRQGAPDNPDHYGLDRPRQGAGGK